jgi:hypothetical protein
MYRVHTDLEELLFNARLMPNRRPIAPTSPPSHNTTEQADLGQAAGGTPGSAAVAMKYETAAVKLITSKGLMDGWLAPSSRQRVHVSRLPETTPHDGANEGVFRSVAREARSVGVGTASGGGKSEGKPGSLEGVTERAATAFPQLRGSVAGPGFEPG